MLNYEALFLFALDTQNMFSKEIFDGGRSWPFEEAKKVLNRVKKRGGQCVLFETGYGPSGLPHIGTFGEVLRTTFVMNAFKKMSDIPCKLFAFSDDMDGFRKVPTNIPKQEMMQEFIDMPLTSVPDPFGKYESFAHHNNAMLCEFLDSFGFDYEFKSATKLYKGGVFNQAISKIIEHYDEIMSIMLPSLREERKKTYSPFLPICKTTGKVLQVRLESVDPSANTIIYKDPITGKLIETSILDGNCKLQWKADWGMRWYALGVDYEMSGKDLIDSVNLSGKICRVIGGTPPEGISYELFLDEEAKKISKSKGNGLSMEEWLSYAPQESLAYYMYQSPKKAKRLYFDIIPAAMDDYLDNLDRYSNMSDDKKIDTAVFHIHDGVPPVYKNCLKFSMLLNLVQACCSSDEEIIFSFVKKYLGTTGTNSITEEYIRVLIGYAAKYYKDFVENKRKLVVPDEHQKKALLFFVDRLSSLNGEVVTPEEIQGVVFEVGRTFYSDDVRGWFSTLYGVLFGCESGPKMGSFVCLYGIENIRNLIAERVYGCERQ